MKTIAFINYKGGVGKTTSTVNCGAGLAREGKRVLLVDTDPQANLTTIAGFTKNEPHTLYELMTGACTTREAIRTTSTLGCAVIPACERLSRVHLDLAEEMDKERTLANALEEVKADYDYILIDCSPTRNLLNDNALVAADEAYIPVQTEHLAAQGLGLMLERIDQIRRKRINTRLRITGVIATMYSTGQKACRGVVEALQEAYSKEVFSTLIRENVALKEAPARQQSVFDYAPYSAGAEDYGNLVGEMLEREAAESEVAHGN